MIRRAVLILALIAGPAVSETLRIGASPTYPPYLSLGADGAREGMDAALLAEICARGGFDCQWVWTDVPDLIPALVAGEIDIVTGGIGNSSEREEIIDFTCPYHVTEDAFGTLWILDPDTDPQGERVAVTAGSLHEKAMVEAGREVIAAAGNAAAIDAVLSGAAEVYFGSAGVVEAHPEAGRMLYAGDHPIDSTGAALAVSEDRPELKNAINSILLDLSTDGTLAALQNRWLSVDQGDIIATCHGGDLLS